MRKRGDISKNRGSGSESEATVYQNRSARGVASFAHSLLHSRKYSLEFVTARKTGEILPGNELKCSSVIWYYERRYHIQEEKASGTHPVERDGLV
jgi:hypothetical protein